MPLVKATQENKDLVERLGDVPHLASLTQAARLCCRRSPATSPADSSALADGLRVYYRLTLETISNT